MIRTVFSATLLLFAASSMGFADLITSASAQLLSLATPPFAQAPSTSSSLSGTSQAQAIAYGGMDVILTTMTATQTDTSQAQGSSTLALSSISSRASAAYGSVSATSGGSNISVECTSNAICESHAEATFADTIFIYGIAAGLISATANYDGFEVNAPFGFDSRLGTAEGPRSSGRVLNFVAHPVLTSGFTAGEGVSITAFASSGFLTSEEIHPTPGIPISGGGHSNVFFSDFKVFDSAGNQLTAFEYASASSTDYNLAGGQFVPEPFTFWLVLAGLGSLALKCRRLGPARPDHRM